MGVFGMQWNKLIMVIIIITHTLNRPFSCVVTAGQLTGQLKLCSRSACIIIIKGPYQET